MPTDDQDEWIEQRGGNENSFMLTNETWKEAGGKTQKNRFSKDEFNPDEPIEGFRFASLDEIEEILGRLLSVNDFNVSPVNWANQKGAVFDKIGIQGQKILAERFLKYVKKHWTFPIRRWTKGKSEPVIINNLEEWTNKGKFPETAFELVGREKALRILGL